MVKHRGDDICGVLLLDKPSGRSSNHVMQQVKRLFNAKKAGHTGSLDPLATGLLPICFGKATCLTHYFLHSDKSYEAVIQLGVTTDSHDSDGDVIETRPVAVSNEDYQAALSSFVGLIEQIPPMVSALKHKGQPLYKLALKGQEIERQPRKVTVHAIQGHLLDDDRAHLTVHCSSGFYVRQLAADLGQKLGCGAHILELRRTTSKHLSLTDSHTLEQLVDAFESAEDQQQRQELIQSLLLAPDELVPFLPSVLVDGQDVEQLKNGLKIDWAGVREEQEFEVDQVPDQHFRIYDSQRKFIGLGLKVQGKLKVHKGFFGQDQG